MSQAQCEWPLCKYHLHDFVKTSPVPGSFLMWSQTPTMPRQTLCGPSLLPLPVLSPLCNPPLLCTQLTACCQVLAACCSVFVNGLSATHHRTFTISLHGILSDLRVLSVLQICLGLLLPTYSIAGNEEQRMQFHCYAVGQCFPHCMLDSNEIVRLIGSLLRVLFTMMLQAMCMQKSTIRLFLLVIKRPEMSFSQLLGLPHPLIQEVCTCLVRVAFIRAVCVTPLLEEAEGEPQYNSKNPKKFLQWSAHVDLKAGEPLLNTVKPSHVGMATALPNVREKIKATDHASPAPLLPPTPGRMVPEEVICYWADHEGAEDGDEILVVCFCGTLCLSRSCYLIRILLCWLSVWWNQRVNRGSEKPWMYTHALST